MTLRESTTDTGELTINYAEGPPSGPPFVLLHGGSARWQYGERFLELVAQLWHVLAPDFRGHGKSGRRAGAYTLADYVRDIAALLRLNVGQPAVVYGHSLGGEVGVMLAARHPNLVRGLIVGDSPLSNRNRATEEPVHRAQNELWLRLAGSPIDEIIPALKDMAVKMPGEPRPKPAREVFGDDNPWFAFQALSLHQMDPDVLAAVLDRHQMLEGYEADVLLPKVTCPVLLLQADPQHGAVLTDGEIAAAQRLLWDVEHVRLQGVGHPLHSTHPAEVLAAITPFVERVTAPR